MTTAEQIVAIIAAFLSPEPAADHFPVLAAGGADPRYPVAITRCALPIAPLEIEGKTVLCGTVDVPADYKNPTGNRYKLKFAVYKAHSLVAAKDAVVHLHGGPGGGIVDDVSLTSFAFAKMRERRDIVAFDQRGVDASGGATRCFETVADNVETFTGIVTGKLPAEALKKEVVQACIDELKARGTDITTINTRDNARDVQSVMQALGYPEYNIYGISYGTKLGLEVMRTAPEGVRAVVLDSVAPPHIATYDTLMTPHDEAIKSTFEYCRTDPACDAAYPDLETRFWALYDKLNETPVKVAGADFNGTLLYGVIDLRNGWQSSFRGLTPFVPKLIAELEKGETATAAAIINETLIPKNNAEELLGKIGSLPPTQAALARAALVHAKTMGETDGAMKSVLGELEALRRTAPDGVSVVQLFEERLLEAAKSIGEKSARIAFATDYLRLRAAEPDRALLIALALRYFEGTTRDTIASLARSLSDEELADVFRRVSTDNTKIENVLMESLELFLYMCQEDMDINSVEGARAVNQTLGLSKQIKDNAEKQLAELYATCGIFQRLDNPGFHDPVTSPIPTMVFSGKLDTQTATSWGPETARHLPNGRSVVFPETGHGALVFSQCAIDIGVAFIENPAAELDTSCTEALKPKFILPDAQ